MSRFILSQLILLSVIASYGQDQDKFDLERFTERMFSVQTADLNYEDLYEQYLQWYMNPLDLNKANEEDLRSLYLLNNEQITGFLEYRDSYGPLISIYELQVIPEFNQDLITKLLPFVKVKENQTRYSMQRSFLISRIDGTIENKLGYMSGRYLGSPFRLYTRLKLYTNQDISAGFTVEKDAGEQVRWSPDHHQYGMDYNSFHFQVRDRGALQNLVVGDFQAQFGQGLVLGSGFFLGKGAATVSTVRKSSLGIRPYTSLVETDFMRGAGVTLGTAKLSVSLIASHRAVDGTVRTDSIQNDFSWISTFQNSGYHRTESELSRKGALTRTVFGGNITYNPLSRLNLGVTGVHTLLDKPLVPQASSYNQFYFRGYQNSTLGTFLNYTWRNITFFSEAAYSASGGLGFVGGSILSLSSDLDVSFLLRNYGKNYHSPYGSAFGETNGLINEKGAYFGFSYRPLRRLSLNGYYDKFSFPWLRYRNFRPSDGSESLLRLEYEYAKDQSVFLQFREEIKTRDIDTADPIRKVAEGRKRNLVLNIEYELTPGVKLRSRIQFSSYRLDSRTEGLAMVQDVNFDIGRKLRVDGRFALIDTDDYENRQYVFERDVLYSFSLPAYHGVGIRTMLLVRFRPYPWLDLWARFARSRYRDRDTVGSGLEQIDGNTKTDLKFQMRVRF